LSLLRGVQLRSLIKSSASDSTSNAQAAIEATAAARKQTGELIERIEGACDERVKNSQAITRTVASMAASNIGGSFGGQELGHAAFGGGFALGVGKFRLPSRPRRC
jgi:hypothetical protein